MIMMSEEDDVGIFRYFEINGKEFVCGFCAAFCNIVITYPMNKVTYRQMMNGWTLKRSIEQLYIDGLPYLYRGMLPPLCQKCFSMSLMFGVYEGVRIPVERHGVRPQFAKIIAGLIAGTTESVMMPFERVQTILINVKYTKCFKNMFHAFKSIKREYGVKELYRGFTPIICRNGPSNVLFFATRDMLNSILPSTMNTYLHNFICGASVGAVVSTVFFPLNVLKVAAQSKLGGPFDNIFIVARSLYVSRDKKVLNIFRGIHLNIGRAILSWGIINTAYEAMHSILE